jgi:GTP-binding protein YchF
MPDPSGPPQVHRSIVKVPDNRLHAIANVYTSRKLIEATLDFIDIPGVSLADHHGREELRRFLPEMRQADMLAAVVRVFDDATVPAYRDRIDPHADLKEIAEELLFADFDTITKRIEKLEKMLRKAAPSQEQDKREHALLCLCRDALENSQPVSTVLRTDEEKCMVAGFGLLTLKPLLVAYNVSEGAAAAPDPPPHPGTAGALNICARAEWDIAQMEPADRPPFLADLGVEEPAGQRLIRRCYDAMGLISFLTIGDKEIRAWTIPRGADALEAAGKIHSDMARGFIRAETVAFDDFSTAGDLKAARTAGKVRQEGKSYVVQDGDIIHFKFNV